MTTAPHARAGPSRNPAWAVAGVLAIALITGCAARSSTVGNGVEGDAVWGQIVGLGAGQLVEVRRRAADGQVVGRIQRADADSLELAVDGGRTVTISHADVTRVTVLIETERDSVANGAWIGAAIGGGYVGGVLVAKAGAGDDRPTAGQSVRSLALGTAVGAGVGALVDWARHRPSRRVVYRVDE